MSANEPSQFSNYPRFRVGPGSPEQLEALGAAYFGFVRVSFLVIASTVVTVFLSDAYMGLTGLIPPAICGLVVGIASYRPCKKLMYGFGKSELLTIWLVLLLALTAPACFGIFLVAIILQYTATRIFQFGVPKRPLATFTMRDVTATVASLREPQAPRFDTVPTGPNT